MVLKKILDISYLLTAACIRSQIAAGTTFIKTHQNALRLKANTLGINDNIGEFGHPTWNTARLQLQLLFGYNHNYYGACAGWR